MMEESLSKTNMINKGSTITENYLRLKFVLRTI